MIPRSVRLPAVPFTRRRRGIRACGVALAVAVLAALVLAPGSPSNPFGEARADQRSEALPALFDSLLDADGAAAAARIEGRIWQEWLDAPDATSRALLGEIDAAIRVRDPERALSLADELVETAPAFAEAWNKRATIHYLLGDDDASVLDIRETLALEPRHFGAISGLGLIFLRQGDEAAALGAFEQVLTISPASGNARRSAERLRRELDRDI